jgi:murein DD-endopeptidase MepM/ murein hydrolase activator NlpD
MLLDVSALGNAGETRFEYGYVVEQPGAQHHPSQPYRAIYAVARRFVVSKASPDAVTHTSAVYAHLQLDTVRAKPGLCVAQGEYISNSGDTCFSAGPHVHFLVLHNVGTRSESVSVTFADRAECP